jgi:TctA family transporter
MLENNLSKSLILARSGGFSIFFSRPISAALLLCTAAVLAYPLIRWGLRRSAAREGTTAA